MESQERDLKGILRYSKTRLVIPAITFFSMTCLMNFSVDEFFYQFHKQNVLTTTDYASILDVIRSNTRQSVVGISGSLVSLYLNKRFGERLVSEVTQFPDHGLVGIRTHTLFGRKTSAIKMHNLTDLSIFRETATEVYCLSKKTKEKLIFEITNDTKPFLKQLPLFSKQQSKSSSGENSKPEKQQQQSIGFTNIGGKTVEEAKRFEEIISRLNKKKENK